MNDKTVKIAHIEVRCQYCRDPVTGPPAPYDAHYCRPVLAAIERRRKP